MSLDEIAGQLQHDLNCLSVNGADRFKRRQALKQLRTKLAKFGLLDDGSSAIAPAKLRDSVILDLLAEPLACSLKDPVESCRSEALTLLRQLTPVNAVRLLNEILPVIVERVDPAVEKSEELRLALVQYLANLLSKPIPSSEFGRHLGALTKVALKALSDPFPDLKLGGCSIIIAVTCNAAAEPCDFDDLVPVLLSNLKHQRQKIRSESLRALFALVHKSILQNDSKPLPKWFAAEVLPAFSNMTSDRSTHVRELLFDEVAEIIPSPSIPDGPLLNSLLAIMLSGLSDENDDVRKRVELRVSRINRSHYPESDRSDFASLICNNVSDLLRSHLLPMISAWTSTIRISGSRMLQTLIGIVRVGITAYVDKVVPCIIHALDDEDLSNVEILCQCAYRLGQHADLDAALQVVYLGLADASNQNGDKVKRCLNFLCFYLRGVAFTRDRSLTSHFISSILSVDNIFSSPNPQLAAQSIQFLHECIECVPVSCKAYEFRFFYALLQVLSLHHGLASAEAILEKFRSLLGLESIAAVGARHFSSVIDTIQSSDIMSGNSRQLLCLVEHTASAMSYEHTHSVITLLSKVFACLDERTDRSDSDNTMVNLASLLMAITSMFQSTPGMDLFIDTLMTDIFSRCLTWHVGRSAAGLRLKAIECLLVGTERNSVIESCSSSVLNQLFPQIVSCLDDYSLDIRIGSLTLLQAFLRKPKIPLSVPDSLGKELLSRLDDSSDQVRIQTCSVLKDLHSTYRKDEADKLLSDIISVAFIHLDDVNPDVQTAVFELLSHLRDSDTAGQFHQTIQNLDIKLMTSPLVEKLRQIA